MLYVVETMKLGCGQEKRRPMVCVVVAFILYTGSRLRALASCHVSLALDVFPDKSRLYAGFLPQLWPWSIQTGRRGRRLNALMTSVDYRRYAPHALRAAALLLWSGVAISTYQRSMYYLPGKGRALLCQVYRLSGCLRPF